MTRRCRRTRRKGQIIVLSAFMMVGMIALLALSLDLGIVVTAKTEAQRSADAAAIAGAWELIDPSAPTGFSNSALAAQNARDKASEFAALNTILRDGPNLDDECIEVGYIANLLDPNSPFVQNTSNTPNAVRVFVRRTDSQNGRVPLFFGRALGTTGANVQVAATAGLIAEIRGFKIPPTGSGTLGILPFALDETTWNALLAGSGSDNWNWNGDEVVAGSDGVLECNLYPQGTGSPGNRGTVDFGGSNNSTNDIARQIVDGLNQSDLDAMGGQIELNSDGKLYLNGDTGISAGVKDELECIKGEPRTIPIFRSVDGPGNNATYTIVKFTGVRIMEVKLTGKMSAKRVMIQPANMVVNGAIPMPGSEETSDFVYTPVRLVR